MTEAVIERGGRHGEVLGGGESGDRDSIERGEAMRSIARRMGEPDASIRTFLVDNAGRRPRPSSSSDLRLTLAEVGDFFRTGRRPVGAGDRGRPGPGRRPRCVGRSTSTADQVVTWPWPLSGRPGAGARRPKVAKLARCRRLRRVVETKLTDYWSPEEISAWLAREYPDDPEMRVSHETIYMSLFVQGRGALRQELHTCLRTGRALRRPRTRTKGGFGQGQLTDTVMIAARPGGGPGRPGSLGG